MIPSPGLPPHHAIAVRPTYAVAAAPSTLAEQGAPLWALPDAFENCAGGARNGAQAQAVAATVLQHVRGDVATFAGRGSTARAWFYSFNAVGQPLFLKVPHVSVAHRMPGELLGALFGASRGLGPDVVPLPDSFNVLLSRDLGGAHLEPKDLHDRPMRRRVLQQLRLLHDTLAPAGAQAAHDIVQKARGRRDAFVAAGVKSLVPLQYVDSALQHFAAVLAARTEPLRLCHNDFTHQNVVRDHHGDIFFVDWDIFGPGHPFEEIARMLLLADLPRSSLGGVLQDYLGREPTAQEAHELSAALGVLEIEFYFYTGELPGDNAEIPDYERMAARLQEALLSL